jgi:hypothetical protein
MSYKLVRVEYKSSVEWYDVDTKLTDEDVNQIEELYAGDVGAFLDNNRRIDEDKVWEGELIREKDTGTTVEWLIEEEL